MNYKKLAKRVAYRVVTAEPHTPKGDLERIVGKQVSRQFGITDAPTEFFDRVTQKVDELLDAVDLELDFNDDEVFPYIYKAVVSVVDEMGLS